jgi:nucleoside-diphosphate-sugar epimerase
VNILLIGGTGLISTPMTAQLRERSHEVTVYNRARRSPDLPEGVRQIVGDRTDHAAFEAQMRDAEPFDIVIDMICYKPEDAESLVRAFSGRVGQMIVCSTVDVYEKPQRRLPITEDVPLNPAPWDYARDKAKLEAILWEADARGDFPLTVFRPGHTYNDGGALHHSVGSPTPAYLHRIKEGNPILVHGDGTSIWAACHAADVARAFTEAAGNETAYGKAYNVAGEEWLTWNRYHELVAEAMGAPEPKLVHIPTELLAKMTKRAWIVTVNFGYNNAIDNSAAARDLNFHTTVPFVEGVRRMHDTLERGGKMCGLEPDSEYDRIVETWQRWSGKLLEEFQAES